MNSTEYREIRRQLGLSQAGLAERLGVSRATINAREANRSPITREIELALRAVEAAAGPVTNGPKRGGG